MLVKEGGIAAFYSSSKTLPLRTAMVIAIALATTF